jgi:glycine/D-amino acid oxidase-like deaminating enzyme/nitrite reductase/ring-hydroxylating ferredoxin subunit
MAPQTSTKHGSLSAWMASATVPHFSPLQGDTRSDVCIIGAGLAGMTTAYMLLREGKSVIVIDSDTIGAGETGRTTAHFFPPDERYFEIERGFGSDKVALVADSYRKATDCVEAIVRAEQIDCDFERLDGYLVSPDGKWDDTLEREYAITTRLGLEVRRLERVPGLPYDTGPCLRFARQAQFHPLRYLAGLAKAIGGLGGRIHSGTRALAVGEGDSGERRVETGRGIINCKSVVVATNTPFNDRVVMHTKQSAYRSYVVALRVPKDAIPRMLLWDTGDPYYYVRLANGVVGSGDELLIVGGQDHKTGQDAQPEHRYDEIEAWTRARFPHAGEVAHRWSGEVMEPADGLAFLGRNPMDKDVYIITGDSGNGMTHCTAGAILVSDLILGRANRWTELYAPSRKAFHGIGEFITEQANTLAQYTDWLRGGDVESVDEIEAGRGALLRDSGRLLAVYRSEDGGINAVSAACTHLGCAVRWNGAEKSWDCPCHGSRFAPDGTVLHGPARRPLAAASLEDDDGGRPGARGRDESRPTPSS